MLKRLNRFFDERSDTENMVFATIITTINIVMIIFQVLFLTILAPRLIHLLLLICST